MNFKLNWLSRIVLFVLFGFGGCIYNQADFDAGIPVMADIRAHDCNPYYVYAEYPEIWPLVEDSAAVRHGLPGLGSHDGMIIGEYMHPAWVYEDTLRRRMYPEWIGRHIIENNLDMLLTHCPLRCNSQQELVEILRKMKEE